MKSKKRQNVVLVLVSVLITVVACSSEKVKETPSPPATLSPAAVTSPPSIEVAANPPRGDQPQALNPESKKDFGTAPMLVVPASPSDVVGVAAVVGSAIGMSKVSKSAEPRSDLNGICVYGEPDSAMVSPCINVTVQLLDEEKRVAATSTTNQKGNFRFSIPKGQSYFVQVVDRKSRTAMTKVKAGRSDVVSLYLNP